MPRRNARDTEQIRREIEEEREQLAQSVADLRAAVSAATDLRPKLPILTAGALGAGFVFAGGIGATMRFLARKGREGKAEARIGRFRVVDRG
jgi:Protein of unknown function (DUF3618)